MKNLTVELVRNALMQSFTLGDMLNEVHPDDQHGVLGVIAVAAHRHLAEVLIPDEAVARNTDPETSHEAVRVLGDLRELQQEVLAAFFEHGDMTDEELGNCFPEITAESTVRKRRSELSKMGLVVEAGRDINSNGNNVTVWRLSGTGKALNWTDDE